tara:strand:- start:520 stop:912 length:393 start_codon:yes stop_codon:yes gene_type:complete
MGRPINKRHIGSPDSGNELKCRFHNGTSEVNGWIIKQKGSRRYRCSDGTNEANCKLVDKAQGSLAAGEMTVTVKDDGGTIRQVTKITGHRVLLDTGSSSRWTFTTDAADDAVEIEEAGTNESFSGADDFE